MLRLFTFVLVLMAVASCASMVSYETAKESLQSAPSCCESLAQFQYEPLAEGEGVSFKLDASSQAFEFETGKSYFKAFRLPAKALPYQIKITSYAIGMHINKAHIFYPQVDLLDDRFSIIEPSVPGEFMLRKAGFNETLAETGGLAVKLEGTVLVDNPDAKYVLVFTTRELMAGTSLYSTRQAIPIILPGLVTAVPGPKGIVAINHSPFGLMHISIE